jgi:acetate---CoA ligase (ADP-forming)
MTGPSHEALEIFFRPRNIALVGASDKSSWSSMIFSRFSAYGHDGRLYAVNRNAIPAHGLRGYKSCADIAAKIDMAYIYVPAASVLEALRQAASAGIRNAVVLSSGFAETGREGANLQAELAAAANELGVTMLGPNSLGFANIAHRCACTSIPTRQPVRGGRLAIVSQSGAIANELGKFAHAQTIGLSFVVATGNEAQIGTAEVVDYLVNDTATGAIAVYVESINHPQRFMAAAARARLAGKPIVLLKIGRSRISGAIAQAHTGALVGDDRVFDAMCHRYGITRTNSIEELILTANFLEKVGTIDPPRVGMVSISGGACGMYADLASTHGLEVPPYADHIQTRLREVLPTFAATLNPLDVTGVAIQDPSLWSRALSILMRDPGLGLIVTGTVVPNTDDEVGALRASISAIVEAYRINGKPPVICSLSLQDVSEIQHAFLQEVGLKIILPGLEFGVRALAHLQHWSECLLGLAPRLPSQIDTTVYLTTERETLEHLARCGIKVISATIAHTADEAVQAAEQLEGAAVLKIASPHISHKTEAGGVYLNVLGAEQTRNSFNSIVQAAKANAPCARIDGVIVSPMREHGLEFIVGIARDPDWGPAIAVGLGGTLAQVLQDSQVRILPVTVGDVCDMLQALRGAELLGGFRGGSPIDIQKLSKVIVDIGDAALALGPELAALEVNPLWVRGGEIECLDALAVYFGKQQ